MKNILKLSFLTVGIAISTSIIAQNDIKTETTNTAEKLEAPKASESKTDANAVKQDPVKNPNTPGNSSTSSKTESKTDSKSTETKAETSKEGGTRMAITEQGVPKKNKNKKSAAATKATPAPKQ